MRVTRYATTRSSEGATFGRPSSWPRYDSESSAAARRNEAKVTPSARWSIDARIASGSCTLRAAPQSRIHGNMILRQDRSRGPRQRRPRLHVGALGHHLRRFGLRDVALILDDEKRRGRAHVEFLLFGGQGLLLQDPRLYGRLIGGPRAPHGDQRVLDLQARLVLQLPQADLRLPELQFVPRHIALGDPIS